MAGNHMVPQLGPDPDELGWHIARRIAAMPLKEMAACLSKGNAAAGMAAGGTDSAGGSFGTANPSPPSSSERKESADALWRGGLSLSWVVWGCANDVEALSKALARAQREVEECCVLLKVPALGSLMIDGATIAKRCFSPVWKFQCGEVNKHAAVEPLEANSNKETV